MRQYQITSLLLAIDSRKGTLEENRIRAFPVMLGFLNLLFCGYMDHYLRNDIDGYYLALLLFLESSMIVLITIGKFTKSDAEIIAKTSVFPTTPFSRLLFVVFSFARNRAMAVLWLTTNLFFVVFYFRSPVVLSVAVVLFSILTANLLLMTAVVSLKLTKSSQPMASFALISVFAIIIVLVGSIVFRLTAFLASLPILSWAVTGILAAQRQEVGTVLLRCCYMILTFIVLLFIGKRVA